MAYSRLHIRSLIATILPLVISLSGISFSACKKTPAPYYPIPPETETETPSEPSVPGASEPPTFLRPSTPEEETPAGWIYYNGDEFGGTAIDNSKWGVYGDNMTGYSKYGQNNASQCMAQTYRPSQIRIVQDGERKVARITASRDGNPPVPQYATDKLGWWSGALSSRDAYTGSKKTPKYYPLYSRIEIKARLPYRFGVWMSLWLRHYKGASTFEIDLEEVFVKWNKEKYKNDPFVLNQSLHGYSTATGKTRYNLNPLSDRISPIDFNPEDNYHIYGVQIDPDIDYPGNHAVISFMVDGRIRSVWRTRDYGDDFNRFLSNDITAGRLDSTWDVAITGQVGGSSAGVGYPEDNPAYAGNISLVPHEYVMDIDWLRVFKRTNTPLWQGSVIYRGGNTTSGSRVLLPAGLFAGAESGDRIMVNIVRDNSVSVSDIDLADASGTSISVWKTDIAKGDARIPFIIEDTETLKRLKSAGAHIYGTGFKLFEVTLDKKAGLVWEGDRTVSVSGLRIGKNHFSGAKAGSVLEIQARDVKPQAVCTLLRNSASGDRMILPSDTAGAGSFNLVPDKPNLVYRFVLNAEAADCLKTEGLVISGTGFSLTSLSLI